jgi:hypothetical protein
MPFDGFRHGRIAARAAPDRHNGGLGFRQTIVLPPTCEITQDSLTIRLASNDGERSRANMLLRRMYSWRGFDPKAVPASSPNCVTFTATSKDDLIGTLTLTVDSGAGLDCDGAFKDELDKFRTAPGASLCELTRFAFDTSLPARPRLAALFHVTFIFCSLHHDCTDLFIEVNPRHRRFYEALLGFTPIGAPRLNSVVNAPAQLMWLNMADLRRKIDEHAGGRNTARTLYANFFSAEEERGIYRRLAEGTASARPRQDTASDDERSDRFASDVQRIAN